MTPAPEELRTRRNSDAASQYSLRSQFSWKGMIQPQPRYNQDGLTTFLGEDQTMPQFLCQPLENKPSGQQESAVRQRGRYLSSPVPGLVDSDSYSASSASISSINPHQMYGFYPDSNGVLYTRRLGGPVMVNTTTPEPGTYRCLFAFGNCREYCTEETWKEHVGLHLSGVEPPTSCQCSICGESINAQIPGLTWSRFLDHILGHNYSGFYDPGEEFLEFCLENDLISDLTRNRLDPNLRTKKMSQEPYQYRNQTPRRFISGDASVARVDYSRTPQPVPERPNVVSIQVNRNYRHRS